MKRIAVIVAVVVLGLSMVLYHELRLQQLKSERPFGSSATIEGTEINVVPQVGGKIDAITVHEGDRVKSGQVLVKLDCDQEKAILAQAKAGVAQAKAAVDGAKAAVKLAQQSVRPAGDQARAARAAAKAAKARQKSLEARQRGAEKSLRRIESLSKTGSMPAEKLDEIQAQAQSLANQVRALEQGARAAEAQASAAAAHKGAASTQVGIARAHLAAAQAALARARAAQTRAAVHVSDCTLTAPRAAYVETRNFQPGEVAMPGDRILTLVDTHFVKATFYVGDSELGAAKPGQKVNVVADAYPKRVFHGKIRFVAAQAEFTPRNIQTRKDRQRLVYAVRADIPNPDRALRPGMAVEVTIPGTGTAK